MHDYLLRRAATSETIKPRSIFIHQLRHQLFSTPLPPLLLLLLLLLFSNHCWFHLSRVTCASSGVAELTTQLRRPLSILWLPLSQINKLGYTTREDCCDPLHLWVIKQHVGLWTIEHIFLTSEVFFFELANFFEKVNFKIFFVKLCTQFLTSWILFDPWTVFRKLWSFFLKTWIFESCEHFFMSEHCLNNVKQYFNPVFRTRFIISWIF